MSLNKENSRIRRLPLYVAMLAALPLGGMSAAVFAADAENEAKCVEESTDEGCLSDTANGAHGPRIGVRSGVGINAGGFAGTGAGLTVSTTGNVNATNNGDIAIGNSASANGRTGFAVAIGAQATADGAGATAIGTGANASASNSVALGAGSVADRENTVSVGNGTQQRQIAYVAAGTQATDAVNVSQLSSVVDTLGGSLDSSTGAVTMPTFEVQGSTHDTVVGAFTGLDDALTSTSTNLTNLINQIDSGTIGLVQQSAAGAPITVAAGKDGMVVDFTGTAGERTLAGVGAGTLSEDSTEAVNGSQLYATNQNVQANTDNITTIRSQIDELESGAAGLVQQDTSTGNITVAAATGGNVVDFAGTDGTRTVTGVADGALSETSTEAVNGSQLNETNQQVSALDDRVSTAEGEISTIKDTLSNLGSDLASGIAYDDSSKSQVTLGGASGTVVSNVAAGSIAAGSMDAINGGQLSDIQDRLQEQLGGLNDRMDNIADGLGNVGNFDGDMANERISNLAPGIEDTDAANLGQVKEAATQAVSTANAYTDAKFDVLNADLQNFKGEVSARFERMDQRIDRIGAISAASTQMAIGLGGVQAGEGRIGAGVGFQNSRSALSVGYAQGVSDRVRVSVGTAFSGSESNYGAGVGVSLFRR
jgi:hypothetical protein